MITLLVYVLLFLLVALVAGNSLPTCTVGIISGKMVTRRTGILIAIIGYSLGFLLEGGLLKTGLALLLPIHSEYLVIIALATALVIFSISHLIRIPQSLPITFAMALIGIDLGYGNSINAHFIAEIIAFWILSAALAVVLTMTVMRLSRGARYSSRVWNAVLWIKLILIILSFFAAFVIGANTIGLLFASVSGITDMYYSAFITIVAIIVGTVLLSMGELRRIGDEILPLRYMNALVSQLVSVTLIEIATLFSIPASSTQIFTSSLYGAGLSYRTRLIRKRPMLTILYSWIATAMASFLLGYIVTLVVYGAV